jgi:hypothetical protein
MWQAAQQVRHVGAESISVMNLAAVTGLTAPLTGLSSVQVKKEIPVHERIARRTRGVKDVRNELLVGRIRS